MKRRLDGARHRAHPWLSGVVAEVVQGVIAVTVSVAAAVVWATGGELPPELSLTLAVVLGWYGGRAIEGVRRNGNGR